MSSTAARNITEIERGALRAPLNLADGHARASLLPRTCQDLRECFDAMIANRRLSIEDAEREFLEVFATRTQQSYLGRDSFLVYSASVAIDVAAKFLSHQGYRVGVIHPAFDNIVALCRYHQIPITPIPEQRLFPEIDREWLGRQEIDALLVVTPNNPTGSEWRLEEVEQLFRWAAPRRVPVILDLSFRLFSDVQVDYIDVAESFGASIITVDDTGKVISLHDTKVSVISCTSDLADLVGLIVSEILLNVSPVTLKLLSTALADGDVQRDEVASARRLARRNRNAMRNRFTDNLPLKMRIASTVEIGSALSVEWTYVGPFQEVLIKACAAEGLEILSGSKFYWGARAGSNTGDEFLRIAILRDPDYFDQGLSVLISALDKAVERSKLNM